METTSAFGRILVGADGSENSKKAVGIAVSLAKRCGAELTVVHVITRPAYPIAGNEGIDASDYFAEVRKESKEWMDDAVRLAESNGVKASGQVLESDSILKAILDYAAKDRVDLIVLGTRGLSNFKRLLIGSVSSGVVNHAECSVLVVR
ncbi:MAG TPA: universal stress protein [Candidatus Acidoferrum sp.]|nr:universal stress protein [Candidatus Acidoferrum sp.]